MAIRGGGGLHTKGREFSSEILNSIPKGPKGDLSRREPGLSEVWRSGGGGGGLHTKGREFSSEILNSIP